MGPVYDWLGEVHRKNIASMAFLYSDSMIAIVFTSPMGEPYFIYDKFEETTTIRFGIEEKIVAKNYVDVFCEDLDLLLRNQTLTLEWFCIKSGIENQDEEGFYLTSRIFRAIENSLCLRDSPFPANFVALEPGTVYHGSSLLKYLDPLKLTCLVMSFVEQNNSIYMDELPFVGIFGFRNAEFSIFVHDQDERFVTEKLFPHLGHYFSTFRVFFGSQNTPNLFDLKNAALYKVNKIKYEGRQLKFDRIPKVVATSRNIHLTNVVTVQQSISEDLALKVFENSLVMERVLAELELFDIQNLRKVSSGIRHCIDDLKPDPHIESYSFELAFLWQGRGINYNEIEVIVGTANGTLKTAKYVMRGSSVPEGWPDKFPSALKDMETNLKHQKTRLKSFQLIFQYYQLQMYRSENIPNVLEYRKISTDTFSLGLEQILRERKDPLRIRLLSLGIENQTQAMQILPYIDKSHLRIIEFMYPALQICLNINRIPDHLLQIDEVSKTEQWNSARILVINHIIVITPIPEMNITHFAELNITVLILSSEDVFYLKTNLLKSPTFEKFKITFKLSAIDETIHNLMGEPHRVIPDVKKIWYFPMPDPDYYLHIVLETHELLDQDGNCKPKVLIMAKVDKEDTPFF